MTLSDVHSPQVAAELIKRLRKRFNSKTCMAPLEDHTSEIVSAHTLSVESMLRKVSLDGHVYAPNNKSSFSTTELPFEIKRKGIRDVSVFNGFCSKHDRDLFSCLDKEPFMFSRQQLFMLAYRALSRECYLKRHQVESLPTAEEYASIHGITSPMKLSEYGLHLQANFILVAQRIEQLKSKFDSLLLQEDWSRIVSHAILFPSTPSILSTSCFPPLHDLNGKKLQNYENPDASSSYIFFSVVPTDCGGAAIFSWLDENNAAPLRFYESVISGENIASAVIHAILDNTDNIAISPKWYESLDAAQKEYLLSRVMLVEGTISYAFNARPDNAAPFLADWGNALIANF